VYTLIGYKCQVPLLLFLTLSLTHSSDMSLNIFLTNNVYFSFFSRLLASRRWTFWILKIKKDFWTIFSSAFYDSKYFHNHIPLQPPELLIKLENPWTFIAKVHKLSVRIITRRGMNFECVCKSSRRSWK
jgi:hypothetical protein